MRQKIKEITKKLKHETNARSRRALFTELWNDVYDDRLRVYKVNFFRGLFFGLGSALGATILIALLITVLGWLVDLPGVGELSQYIRSAIKASR